MVVTAVTDSGFNVQDPTQLGSPGYSGIYVYIGSSPSVTRGDVVEVDGEVDEYYGWTQIIWIKRSQSATRARAMRKQSTLGGAHPVTVSMASSEGTRRLGDLTDAVVTNWTMTAATTAAATATMASGRSRLGQLRCSLLVYVIDAYECPGRADTIEILPVTGVMMFRWDRRRRCRARASISTGSSSSIASDLP